MSADENLAIHEYFTGFASRYAQWLSLFPDNHGAWVPVYLVAGLLGLLFSWRAVLIMTNYHLRQTVLGLGGILSFLTGAVVIEIAGYYELFSSNIVQVGIEEVLEMFGASMILVGCLELLVKAVRITPIHNLTK